MDTAKLTETFSVFPLVNLFDKNFLTHKLKTGIIPFCFTVDFEKGINLGMTVGRLTSKGYPVQQNGDGSFLLLIDQYKITLRKRKPLLVTDFDELRYCATRGSFYYQAKPLTPELQEKFLAKKCTLTFDVYEKQDTSELWTARRRALLEYLDLDWKIFNSESDEVTFRDLEDSTAVPVPENVWLVLKKEKKLTIEDFHAEIAVVVAKYYDVIRENYSGVVIA